MKPIIICPGFGGSILVNRNAPTKKIFHKPIVDNRWLQLNPKRWKMDHEADIISYEGRVQGFNVHNPDIIPYDFGGLNGVRNISHELMFIANCLSPLQLQDELETRFNHSYFDSLIRYLEKEKGYGNETLFAAPYDFRYILDPITRLQTFTKFKHLIETSHKRQKVVLICHSLGAIVMKWFLNDMDSRYPGWTAAHVDTLIAINPPFGGMPRVLKSFLSGEHYIKPFRKFILKPLQYNCGLIMMLPNELGYEPGDPFLQIGSDKVDVTYNTSGHLNLKVPLAIWRELFRPFIPLIRLPTDVNAVIIQSDPTPNTLTYLKYAKDLLPGDNPEEEGLGLGDGMVPLSSIEAYKKIFSSDRVRVHSIPSFSETQAKHGTIIYDAEFFKTINYYL